MNTTASQLGPLVVLDSPAQESRVIAQHITTIGSTRGELSILEAGCGNSWTLELPGVSYWLTGVDLNQDALEIRVSKYGDLHQAIHGDLRTVDLDENRYDVIYNAFVLEHVEDAVRVLDNFRRWLAPGGLLVLKIPDPRSVYGALARLTPFWFHVLYKRYIAGCKNAGKPGFDPFPTVYDEIVSRSGIHGWCAAHGMTIREEIGWNYAVGRPGLMSVAVRGFIKTVNLLSLGALAADHVNLTYVIEKPATVNETTDRRRTPVSTEVTP